MGGEWPLVELRSNVWPIRGRSQPFPRNWRQEKSGYRVHWRGQRVHVHFSLLHSTGMDCTALFCTALHCSALHCTTLHCTELQTQYTLYYETQLDAYRGWNVFQCSALQHIIAHCSIIPCTAVQYSASQCTVIKRTCYSDAPAVWLVLQAPFTRLKLSLTDWKT